MQLAKMSKAASLLASSQSTFTDYNFQMEITKLPELGRYLARPLSALASKSQQ